MSESIMDDVATKEQATPSESSQDAAVKPELAAWRWAVVLMSLCIGALLYGKTCACCVDLCAG